MWHEYSSGQNARPLNSRRREQQNLPQCSNRMQNLCQCQHQALANKSCYSPQYHSSDAIVELIGRVNEDAICVGDIQVTAVINTGAQVSTITLDFCDKHGDDIHPVKQMSHLEGTGGFSILYLGYIEATVRIPPIKDYDQCVPMLILMSSSPYSLRVLVQLGTTVLDRAMARITVEELAHASNTWWQIYMSTMATAKVAGTVEIRDEGIPTINVPLVTTKPIMIPPFGCKGVKGLVESLPVCSYHIHVVAEPIESHQLTWGSWLLALTGISTLDLEG